MLRSNERNILFFDMYTQPSKKGRLAGIMGAEFKLYINIIRNLVRDEKTIVVGGRRRDKVLYISDYSVDMDKEIMVLLVNLSDRAAADPVITNPEKKKRRDISKNFDEGADYSAHVVISFRAEGNGEGRLKYLCVIEQVPGLAVSKIEVLINRILRKGRVYAPSLYQANHPDGLIVDGRIKQVKYSPEVTFSGHLSQSFADQLESGRIESIELYKDVEVLPFDSEAILMKDRETLSLKINKKIKVFNFKAITAALTAGRRDYDTLRVKLKKPNGHSVTQNLDLGDEEAMQALLIRKERVEGFDDALKTSSERINRSMVEKIVLEMGL